MIEADPSISGVFGFSRGGYSAYRELNALPENVRGRIKEAVILGSPGTGSVQGVPTDNQPNIEGVGHMGMVQHWTGQRRKRSEGYTPEARPTAFAHRAERVPPHQPPNIEPTTHPYTDYHSRNVRIQDSAARHGAVYHHQPAAPPQETVNKNPSASTGSHASFHYQQERRNVHQTADWTSPHKHPSVANASRVQNAFRPRTGSDDSMSTTGLSNA
jgi:hypothetical protein